MHHYRPSCSNLILFLSLVSTLLFLSTVVGWSQPDPLTETASDPRNSTPSASLLCEVQFKDPFNWFLESDIGYLHVYGDDQLHTFDILNGGVKVGEPVSLPGADEPGSVVHLSATPYLLFSSAKSGLKDPQCVETRDRSSYLLDISTGELLWEAPVLPIPFETFLFEENNIIIVQYGPAGYFSAVDLDAGEIRWEKLYRSKTAVPAGRELYTLGLKNSRIDVSSGNITRQLNLSQVHIKTRASQGVIPFPKVGVAVLWTASKLFGYQLPANMSTEKVVEKSKATDDPDYLWKTRIGASIFAKEVTLGFSYAKAISPERLLIAARYKFLVFDVVTGKLVCSWNRLNSPGGWVISSSPSGRMAIHYNRKGLRIINLETGEVQSIIKSSKALSDDLAKHLNMWNTYTQVSVFWRSEDEFILTFLDETNRPAGLALFNIPEQKFIWNKVIPEPAEYDWIEDERRRFDRKFAARAIVAGLMGNILIDRYHTQVFQYISVDSSLRSATPVDDAKMNSDNNALKRYSLFQERLEGSIGSYMYIVSGDDPPYTFFSVDLNDGQVREIASYDHEKIDGIIFVSASDIAVSLERGNTVFRLIRTGD